MPDAPGDLPRARAAYLDGRGPRPRTLHAHCLALRQAPSATRSPPYTHTVAAAAAGLPAAAAEPLLDTLVDANMLEDAGDGRYRFHDLLGLHARLHAVEDSAAGEQEAAVRGALDWYLACASAADQVVMPHRRRAAHASACPPELVPPFPGPAAALAWLETERVNLLAAVRAAAARGWHATTWQLVDAMWSLFLHHKHYHDWVESHLFGIDAARACGHLGGEAMLLNHLGLAFHGLGQFEAARVTFSDALAIHLSTGDRPGEASALNSLGLALHALGEVADAIDLFRRAAAMQEASGEHRGEALTRANLGRALGETGHAEEARQHLPHALSVFAALPDPYNHARTLHSLGRGPTPSGSKRGSHGAPDGGLRHALAVMRELGAWTEEAQILVTLGDRGQAARPHRAAGAPDTVRPRDRPDARQDPARLVGSG